MSPREAATSPNPEQALERVRSHFEAAAPLVGALFDGRGVPTDERAHDRAAEAIDRTRACLNELRAMLRNGERDVDAMSDERAKAFMARAYDSAKHEYLDAFENATEKGKSRAEADTNHTERASNATAEADTNAEAAEAAAEAAEIAAEKAAARTGVTAAEDPSEDHAAASPSRKRAAAADAGAGAAGVPSTPRRARKIKCPNCKSIFRIELGDANKTFACLAGCGKKLKVPKA